MHESSSQSESRREPVDSEFFGYESIPERFTKIPLNIFWDEGINRLQRADLIALVKEIAEVQFMRGWTKTRVVPLTWDVVTKALELKSTNAAKSALAILEQLGRIRIVPGEDGINRFGLRWSEDQPTDHLRSWIDRRQREILRRNSSRSGQNSRELEGECDPASPSKTKVDGVRRRPKNGDCRTPIDSSKLIETKVVGSDLPPAREKRTEQSVSQSATKGAFAPGNTDGLTDDVRSRIRRELGKILDPPQVPRAMQFSIWCPSETWWILEGIRIHAAWSECPARILYPALIQDTTRVKGQIYLDKLGYQSDWDWVSVAQDATSAEDPVRKAHRLAMGKARRLPLGQEEEKIHQALLAQEVENASIRMHEARAKEEARKAMIAARLASGLPWTTPCDLTDHQRQKLAADLKEWFALESSRIHIMNRRLRAGLSETEDEKLIDRSLGQIEGRISEIFDDVGPIQVQPNILVTMRDRNYWKWLLQILERSLTAEESQNP